MKGASIDDNAAQRLARPTVQDVAFYESACGSQRNYTHYCDAAELNKLIYRQSAESRSVPEPLLLPPNPSSVRWVGLDRLQPVARSPDDLCRRPLQPTSAPARRRSGSAPANARAARSDPDLIQTLVSDG